ncbi:MAG: leucyl/phenylalanyl-tRNA--protein transferase [Vicinamibacterales bacterium]
MSRAVIPVELLLEAYAAGWFPMGEDSGDIAWYSPDPRGVLPLDAFHVPARLGRLLRQRPFTMRVDGDFRGTIEACAERGETWITPPIVESYVALHERGYAHSVEAWAGGRLVGGLYGVHLGGVFFGESMFHTQTDASKVALCHLVDLLRARGFGLLDIQWVTPHLARFGAVELSRDAYLARLRRCLRLDCAFA